MTAQPAFLPDAKTTVAVADALDAESQAAAANKEARRAAWNAARTVGTPEVTGHFQEACAWAVAADAWSEAAATAARKSGSHPAALDAADGAAQAAGYAKGQVRLAMKAVRAR